MAGWMDRKHSSLGSTSENVALLIFFFFKKEVKIGYKLLRSEHNITHYHQGNPTVTQ